MRPCRRPPENSPGLGLGRVRSSTMCSWYLLFPFFRISFQKIWNGNKMKQISEKKKRVRATIPGICARTVVSCWKSAHARGAVREPRESIIDPRDPLGRALFWYLFFASFVSHKIEISYENGPQNGSKVITFGSCFQKMKENRKMRFDCTGVYGLHMSPHRGAPRATQNYTKKQTDSRNPFFLGKIRKYTKNDPQKVSKWVRVFLANVPLAPFGSALVPQSVF